MYTGYIVIASAEHHVPGPTPPDWNRMSDPKDPQRRVAWLNRFFRKIVGPAHVDNSRPGGYYENEHLRHERLDAMGLEMRTDANGHSYVVEKKKPE
ncbi:hypothetical protein GCM10009691_13770 [Brevibacterium picturae]|uniref:Uncharacterized protein n=2 Tax=Brevibacterium picturae TaxID=260553 RepID=A0ABP4M953_9MICO